MYVIRFSNGSYYVGAKGGSIKGNECDAVEYRTPAHAEERLRTLRENTDRGVYLERI